MSTLSRQTTSKLGSPSTKGIEYQFTIRPELSPSGELSASTVIDQEARAFIAEFEKLRGIDQVSSRQEIKLLLDRVDSRIIRNYLIESLGTSVKAHFGFSEVRADIFKALTPYVDDPLVRLVCAQEFERRIDDSISCQAAGKVFLEVRTLDLSPEVRTLCSNFIEHNLELLDEPPFPPGMICALRVLDRDPGFRGIDEEVAMSIDAYRTGKVTRHGLDRLAAIGTEKTWAALAKMADHRLSPRFSLNPNDHEYLNNLDTAFCTYFLGSMVGGGLSSLVFSLAIASTFNSPLRGVQAGFAMFALGFLLPTLVPATYKATLGRKSANPEMSDYALRLIAKCNPDLEDGRILLKALSDPKRSGSSNNPLIAGLTKAQSTATIENISNFLKTGPAKVRLKLLRALAYSWNPEIQAAIVGCKNDVVMEVGAEATKIVARWKKSIG